MFADLQPDMGHGSSNLDSDVRHRQAVLLLDAAWVATRQGSLASLSRKQFGLVTRAQLRNAGFSSSWVTRARHRGELAPYQHRVWRITSVPRCWEQRPMGAVLSIGGQTVASHITSAFVQELLPRASAGIEVTTDRSPGERRGIVVHRNSLNSNDIVNVGGIPSTSVYRTLIDLCASQSEPFVRKSWMPH
jgi:hypothetical protein